MIYLTSLLFIFLLNNINVMTSSPIYHIVDALELLGTNHTSLLNANFVISSENEWEHSVGMAAFRVKNSSVVSIYRGKTEYSNVYCFNKNVTTNSVFNIGSITKLFFAATLLRLIGDRPQLFPQQLDTKLSYYQPYLKAVYKNNSKFISNMPQRPNYDKITIRKYFTTYIRYW